MSILSSNNCNGRVEFLAPEYVAKPWGRTNGIPMPDDIVLDGEALGEIIFKALHTEVIVKWLQTSESLSVQVHPQKQKRKHEWWYITDAEPGAFLYLGLKESTSVEALQTSALNGSLTNLLNRIEPKSGDSFFVEAGTIHALGPGLTLAEVQEVSDVTYRLFDYGRPRELHLEQGLKEVFLDSKLIERSPGLNVPFQVRYISIQMGEKCIIPNKCCVTIVSGFGSVGNSSYKPYQCFEVMEQTVLAASINSEIIIATTSPI